MIEILILTVILVLIFGLLVIVSSMLLTFILFQIARAMQRRSQKVFNP